MFGLDMMSDNQIVDLYIFCLGMIYRIFGSF